MAKKILAGTIISGALALHGTEIKYYDSPSGDSTSTAAIRPFKVHIPESDLKDLNKRILSTKWPKKETDKTVRPFYLVTFLLKRISAGT